MGSRTDMRPLGAIGSKAKSHVNDLILLLNDRDPIVFSESCWALMNMGEPGERAVQTLTAFAKSKDEGENKADPVRKFAAQSALNGIEFYAKNKDKLEKMDEKKEVKKDK